MTIAVHQTKPAPEQVAGWIQRLLAPVVLACRITTPPPIELRPMPGWGGFCSTGIVACHDRRVMVSNQAEFWSKQSLTCVYIHETTHRLLNDFDGDIQTHGCIFFALQLLLLHRLDASKSEISCNGGWSNCVNLYDLQEAPDCLADLPRAEWLARCLTFSMAIAAELASTEMSAEALAAEIVNRYGKWVDELDKEPQEKAVAAENSRKSQSAIRVEIAGLRTLASQRGWYMLMGGGWFFSSLMFIFFLAAR